MRSAASGGAFSGNGARRSCYCCTVRAEGGRRRMARGTERRKWLGNPSRRPDQGGLKAGRGASNAGVRPPRGRRRVERGGRRACGREGKGEQPGPLAGPKGERGWPGSACPFPFFF